MCRNFFGYCMLYEYINTIENNKNDMKKEKNMYITPLLTVVEFRTERGYAMSGVEPATISGELNMFADYINAGANNLAMGARMDDASSYFSTSAPEGGFGGGFGSGYEGPLSGEVSGGVQSASTGGYFGKVF